MGNFKYNWGVKFKRGYSDSSEFSSSISEDWSSLAVCAECIISTFTI